VTLTSSERADLLSNWIKPSSQDEQTQQDRAERMITDAIKAHSAFADTSISVYAKGSYANKTNVRRDSDVDILVENRDCWYYDYFPADIRPTVNTFSDYTGLWTPARWRAEVTKAMTNCFGPSDVDTSGEVALEIAAVAGSRPSADVVPSFAYQCYYSADHRDVEQGSKVFKKSGGAIINWPDQQLRNGRQKNTATGGRYKDFVRALKNAENRLVKEARISAMPSYFIECLVWNVPNPTLQTYGLDNGFRATLVWLWEHLTDQFDYQQWDEPNRLKYLFHPSQKWTRDDGKDLVLATWQWLDY
jgi:hypothetical protein